MSSVRHKGENVRTLAKRLRSLGAVAAQRIASRSAPVLTTTSQADFNSGRTAYGDARPAGKQGNQLTLVSTGATRATLRFGAQGTAIRAVLTTKWARYLIGKYRVLPIGRVPTKWKASIAGISRDTMRETWEK